jgi:hypothetical protein
VDLRIRREQAAGLQRVFAAVQLGHDAAGFLDEQDSRGHVPGLQVQLPEGIEPAARDVGEVERGGAGAAHSRGLLDDRAELRQVGVEARAGADRHARADERVIQHVGLADADLAAVQHRAPAALRDEKVLRARRVDHAELELPLVLQADRHGEVREAVQEVRRAVERVDDPEPVALPVGPAFLREDRVVGMRLADRVHDLGFGTAVDVRDEVVAALAVDLDLVGALEVPHDVVAGRARGGDGDVFEGERHGAAIIEETRVAVSIAP